MSESTKTTELLVAESPESDDGAPVYGEVEDIEPYFWATPVDTMWVPSPESMGFK